MSHCRISDGIRRHSFSALLIAGVHSVRATRLLFWHYTISTKSKQGDESKTEE